MWNGNTCTIEVGKRDNYGNYPTIEKHIVNIIEEEKFGSEFKKILNEKNELAITSSIQGDKIDLIKKLLHRFSMGNFYFEVFDINEDRTKCTIKLGKKNYENYPYGYSLEFVEQHYLNISYEEKYSEDFKRIFNKDNNKMLITSSSLSGKKALIDDYIEQFTTGELIYRCDELSEDGTVCTISISGIDEVTRYQYIKEQHVVNVIYEEKISDEFKKILNDDGNILIKSSRDYDIAELLRYFCSTISEATGVYFEVSHINEDATACTLKMCEDSQGYGQKILEQHTVNIVYDRKMSEDFKNVLEDGKLVIKSVKPTIQEDWWSLSEVLFMSLKEEPWFVSYEAEDLSALDLTIIDSNGDPETHRVEVVFEYDENIKKVADELLKKMPENKIFTVNDLELVNYWLNGGKNETKDGVGKFDNYSGELKKLAENKNFNIVIDHRMGNDDEFLTERGGIALLQYNGVTYGIRHCIDIKGNHILYVPDDTPSTKEALLSAIQKRVDEYAGVGKVKITAGEGTTFDYYKNDYDRRKNELQDKINLEKAKENPNKVLIYQLEMELSHIDYSYEYFLESYNDSEFGERYFLKSAEGGYWFKATIDGEDYEFIVVKDSSKMVTPTYKTADISTNVEISSTSATVPLDTAIEATRLTSGEVYDKIIDILNVKDNETFDLKLYSNSLEKYITKLEDGTFEVRIPLPDKFKGKTDLKVYYVDENGKVQEHEVEIKDGYAIFTTNHFSIYTLSEKIEDIDNQVNTPTDGKNDTNINNNSNNTNNNETNVKTGDNIMLYVVMFVISVIGILVTRKIKKV